MIPPRDLKAVLFDLDDTLFDHRHAARRVLQDLQSRHPSLQRHSLEFLEREDFRLLSETHALVMAGMIDVAEWRIQRVQSLFACCGEEISTGNARRLADCRQIVYRENRRAAPGAIPLLRKLMGATNPAEALPGTIRGDLGGDHTRNTIHGSDAPETAEREIAFFFQEAPAAAARR